MLISCANATYKIYAIKQEVKEDEICNFVNNFFSDESKIDLQMLTKWCLKVREIRQFFACIKKQGPNNNANSNEEAIMKNDSNFFQ